MQTRKGSMLETVVSTTVGFIISYILNLIIVPLLFDVHPTASQNITMVCLFTIASLLRGYFLRRFFNQFSRTTHGETTEG